MGDEITLQDMSLVALLLHKVAYCAICKPDWEKPGPKYTDRNPYQGR
jgi:hypothetical protein